uniref:GDP-mannose 4,6-dehydratase n=1 Tax=Anopheles albimanus TaxID=7167 RepID=A0A182FXX2_ANOAL
MSDSCIMEGCPTVPDRERKVALITGITGQEPSEDFLRPQQSHYHCTGETHSVPEFVEKPFAYIGRAIVWHGSGVVEVGVEKGTDMIRVRINPKFYRPTEVDWLLGDARKAKQQLAWSPKVTFLQLIPVFCKATIVVACGSGVDEVGVEKGTDTVRVRINPKFFRPTEVDLLLGDASKAKQQLGWTPKVTFLQLIADMMEADIELMKNNPKA